MKFWTDKRFRYGTFSIIMMLLAVILFVFVNLVAGEFNFTRDLTREQLFSLTPESRNFLSELNQDVTIFSIAPTGQENAILSQLLEEYASASSHISVQQIDPTFNPGMVLRFATEEGIEGGIPNGSVVVESGAHRQVIFPTQMVVREINWQTMQWGRIVSWNFESEITRAIHHVVYGITPVVYVVGGSGEFPINPMLGFFLESENFIVDGIDLVMNDIPENADILIIIQPTRDWTEVKAQRIRTFLENDGRALFILDNIPINTPNMDAILAAYGIAIGEYLILEGDSHWILGITGSPTHIIPTPTNHEIATSLVERNVPNLLYHPASIQILDARPVSTTIEPVWVTSRSAYGRIDEEATTIERIPSDISGPFNLAVAVTDRNHVAIDRTYTTRFVVVSSVILLEEMKWDIIGSGNYHFIGISLSWLLDNPPSIFIPPRVPAGIDTLQITAARANLITIISMLVIPIMISTVGAFVWLRRRNS